MNSKLKLKINIPRRDSLTPPNSTYQSASAGMFSLCFVYRLLRPEL